MLEYIILGILCGEGLTGYDIRKQIENGIGMFYKASYGSIYPILAKLEKSGDVTCEEQLDGKRVSKRYTITPSGRKHFIDWLRDYSNKGATIETFMAKVFFFDRLEGGEAESQLAQYQKELEAYLDSLMAEKNKYENLPNQEQFYYKLSTLYFGIAKLQSLIAWCDTTKKKKRLESLIRKEGL